ncbi:MAG: hypothetical protein SGJ00_07720 [bacterium]|nr:hypothetical protein [bacterium]
MTHFAHIINPVDAYLGSDFYKSQQITFASMIAAKNFSNKDNIQLCVTQFEADKTIIPTAFTQLSKLTQSIFDINKDLRGKKLPLIAEILSKLKEVPQADYCIYTNADIALMPHFYETISEHILQGFDAIVINRRRISKRHLNQSSLNQMYSDLGRSHPGFDCFIFSKDLLNQFVLGNICIGVPFLEVTLMHNLISFANKPLFIADAHLTFHLGMDVMPSRNKAYYWQNRNEFFKQIYPKLKPHFKLDKFPYAALPWPQRALKWILNPSLFTANYFHLESEHFFNEMRWRFLQR